LLSRLKVQTQFESDPAHAPLQRVSHEFDVVAGYFSGAGGGIPGRSPWYARLGRGIVGLFRRTTGQTALNERQRSATYHALLDKIKANLEKSKDDPTQIAKTLGDAGYQFTTNVSQPLRAGREGERGLDPVIALLQRPIDHAVGGVTPTPVAGARPHGGGAFAGPLHQQLAAAFDGQLKPYYPFSSGATVDVSAAALQSFFGPGGSFWSALAALKITDLINEDGSPKSAGAAGVDASVVACVKRAYEIRQSLFSAGAPGMKVYVEPEQIDAPHIDWTELSLGGAPPYHYDNGFAEERSLNWPGDRAEAGATLSTHRCEPPVSHEGLWGLFHIVEISNRSRAGDAVRATWTMRAGGTPVHVTWKLRVQGAPRNPFEPGFFSDFRLP
ncbi:MAG TPA: type VI secretion IcmF C-terminal domain-containing protein, partial [Candidatus Bathyarchaeia archaeon]|nr:type VI secretion IcmF C-terminal domain-containing protein [Candidatus Bathyarchaeia archaeon]